MHHIHGLEQFLVLGLVAQGQVEARIGERHTRTSKDARLIILLIFIPEGEHENLMPGAFEDALMKVNMICHTAHVRLVRVHHHSDTHESIVQATGDCCQGALFFLMVESISEE